jgi:dihydrofolate reductase
VDLGRPLIAIAAVARNRGIGLHNKLPWRIPEDFAFFKATTMGQVLLMGRKTYESIGRPLPGRTTVVLSRSGFSAPGVIVAKDWQEAAQVEPTRTLFLAGGAALYAEALPWCAELILTHVAMEPEADAFSRTGRGGSTPGRSSPGTPPARCADTGPSEVLTYFAHN